MAEKQTGKQRTMRHDDKRVDTDPSGRMRTTCARRRSSAQAMSVILYANGMGSSPQAASIRGALSVAHDCSCPRRQFDIVAEISRTFTRPAHLRRRQASQSPLFHKREEWKAKESRPGPATVTALSLKRVAQQRKGPYENWPFLGSAAGLYSHNIWPDSNHAAGSSASLARTFAARI
ncbi:hypothetical protein COCCADRAFT_22324 [Bipolaris zeicola 26-R-13]|uniref:Uncharacterized protein n=1 Tax=Cochliobolus carbonum (strain 26-R-13) TaxID=930089 RepID=W6YFF5_COCC2|nr:uncharacterized protein COCCADRAFT_22324 [Bipolaris zeicola 26-R-13]EUC38202.1 hypothetical protein COCCADRAFT_22324 [Bipolaris zeicola 26-R-13]